MFDSLLFRRLMRLLCMGAAVYAGLLVLFLLLQRSMIYYPVRENPQALVQEAAIPGLEPWRNPEGEIIGWKLRAETPEKPLLILFHGNAGHALHRHGLLRAFESAAGNAVQARVFEYPGYGAREGSPSEEAFIAAAADALEPLLSEQRPVLLCGRSIGSGVACAMAARFSEKIGGLLLVTPFTRLVDVASHHYPWLPCHWILRERWNNVEWLTEYGGPVAVAVAEDDEIIPPVFGRRLFEAYQGPKLFHSLPGASHNDLPVYGRAPWLRDSLQFLLREP